MIMGLTEYDGHKLRNVDEADIDLSDIGTLKEEAEETQHEPVTEDAFGTLVERFKTVLGDHVQGVRQSKTLVGSPARLVSDDTSSNRNMFRINRLLDKEHELPVKTLELNPRHPLLHNLSGMIASSPDNQMIDVVIEQLFETALLQDGIHPDPASMADRLLVLLEAATGTPLDHLNLAAVAPEANPVEPEAEAAVSAETADDEEVDHD